MIEPTDEMVRVLYAELAAAEPGRHHAAVRRGLAAVLALVAADVRAVLNQRYAPHVHARPGIWDRDGMPCTDCAARTRLVALLGSQS